MREAHPKDLRRRPVYALCATHTFAKAATADPFASLWDGKKELRTSAHTRIARTRLTVLHMPGKAPQKTRVLF